MLDFMYDFNILFDNNLAERNLQMTRLNKKFLECLEVLKVQMHLLEPWICIHEYKEWIKHS